MVSDLAPGSSRVSADTGRAIVARKEFVSGLIALSIDYLPRKAYGVIGGTDLYHPSSVYQCFSNLRNTPDFKEYFESFGDFYKNPDRGFVVSAEEVWSVTREMRRRQEDLVGVFHAHRVFVGGEPTRLDRATHLRHNGSTLSYIINVENPAQPTLRAFRIVDEDTHEEITFEIER
jgi:hypothetical protein